MVQFTRVIRRLAIPALVVAILTIVAADSILASENRAPKQPAATPTSVESTSAAGRPAGTRKEDPDRDRDTYSNQHSHADEYGHSNQYGYTYKHGYSYKHRHTDEYRDADQYGCPNQYVHGHPDPDPDGHLHSYPHSIGDGRARRTRSGVEDASLHAHCQVRARYHGSERQDLRGRWNARRIEHTHVRGGVRSGDRHVADPGRLAGAAKRTWPRRDLLREDLRHWGIRQRGRSAGDCFRIRSGS